MLTPNQQREYAHWLINAQWSYQFLSTISNPTATERAYLKDLELFIPLVTLVLENHPR